MYFARDDTWEISLLAKQALQWRSTVWLDNFTLVMKRWNMWLIEPPASPTESRNKDVITQETSADGKSMTHTGGPYIFLRDVFSAEIPLPWTERPKVKEVCKIPRILLTRKGLGWKHVFALRKREGSLWTLPAQKQSHGCEGRDSNQGPSGSSFNSRGLALVWNLMKFTHWILKLFCIGVFLPSYVIPLVEWNCM